MADEEDPISQLKQQILRMPNFSSSYASFMDDVQGFYHAVAWKEERWMQALFVLEALLLVLVFVSRRVHYLAQFALLFVLASMIACAETLNTLARTRWTSFATQNYFDVHGVFAGVVYATPLLVILLIHIVLLIKVTLCNKKNSS